MRKPNKDLHKLGVALLAGASVALAAVIVVGFSGPSQETIKRASEQCLEFYKEKRAGESTYVQAINSWTKNGKLVIELAEQKGPSDSSYTSGLCLYDLKKGVLTLPGLFDQNNWYE